MLSVYHRCEGSGFSCSFGFWLDRPMLTTNVFGIWHKDLQRTKVNSELPEFGSTKRKTTVHTKIWCCSAFLFINSDGR